MRAALKVREPNLTPTTASPPRTGRLQLAIVLIGLAFLFPAGYLLWGTLTLGGDFWGSLVSARTLRPLANSLLIATSTAAACAVLGTVLAWIAVRTDLPGRRLWRVVFPLPLVIPSFVGATAVLSAFGSGGLIEFVPRLEGFWGAFVVLTLLSYPYVYLPVAARLSSTSASIEEASRLLGSRPVRTVFRIVLPQAREAIIAGTLLVFLYGLSDFGAVSLMRFDTITRAIFSARLFDRATALTLGLLLAILALVVAAVVRVLSLGTKTQSAETKPLQYPLGAATIPTVGLVVGVISLALVTPVSVFLFWTLRGSTTVGVGFSGIGDGLGFLIEPLLNSLLAATVAGAAAVLVVLPVAYASAKRRNRLSETVSTVISSVFAIPGLVVALAVVFWAIQAPDLLAGVYQTFPLLIFAYVLHFGAQSMGASQAAIAAIPSRLDEAAKVLGADSRRRFLTIDLPLIFPGLVAGGGLVLLSTLKELPATLLLAPTGFSTLATRIWGAAEDGFFAEVGVTSLILVVLSGVLTWLLILRRGQAP